MRTAFIPQYLNEGRDMTPPAERRRLCRTVRRLTGLGITQREIAIRAGVHPARVTRLLKPEIKNGRPMNYSRAYAERLWVGIVATCEAHGIDILSING